MVRFGHGDDRALRLQLLLYQGQIADCAVNPCAMVLPAVQLLVVIEYADDLPLRAAGQILYQACRRFSGTQNDHGFQAGGQSKRWVRPEANGAAGDLDPAAVAPGTAETPVIEVSSFAEIEALVDAAWGEEPAEAGATAPRNEAG